MREHWLDIWDSEHEENETVFESPRNLKTRLRLHDARHQLVDEILEREYLIDFIDLLLGFEADGERRY